MSYTYDIATSKKDNRSTTCLTISHLLFSVINLFLSTFLIAHIYSLTDNLYEYAFNVGLYEVSSYLVMLISYYLFSFLVDKTNRIWVYRLGNMLSAGLVIVTIFFGKDLAKLILLAGALYGLSKGAYYASYNVLKQEMVSRKSMKNFAVVIMVLTKLVNTICPILLGMLIEVSTFSMVAVYVFILSVILISVTFFIKAKRPQDSNFNIKDYLTRLKTNVELNNKMKNIYKICFIYGFTSVVGSLLSVNVMIHFGSNFSLGIIKGVCTAIAICALLLMTRFTKFGKRSCLFILCSILPAIGVLIFAIVPNMITLVVYHIIATSVDIVVATTFDIIRNRNLKEAGFYQDIAEHQCITESLFQFSRILSYGMLVLISLFKNFALFQIAFVVFTLISYCTMPIMLAKFEKKFKSESAELKIENNENIK